MSLIAQLRNVIFGDSAERPNDIEYDESQSQTHVLPPNPYAQHSPARPGSSPSDQIDLTLSPPPSRPLRSLERQERLANTHHPRSALKGSQRSADELRLFGDFDKPADSVFAPDPSSHFSQPAMVKPGNEGAYKPINTINGVNPGHSKSRPVTYGKIHKHISPTIGRTLGEGQRNFLAKQSAGSVVPPVRSYPSRQDQHQHHRRYAATSPTKRRKTENAPSSDVIDLSGDDDDVQEIVTKLVPTTPGSRHPDAPRSAHSTHSRLSVESDPNLTGNRSGSRSRPTSEFQSIEKTIRGSRCPSKSAERQRNLVVQSIFRNGRSVSGSLTPHTRGSPIPIHDDEPASPKENARQKIFAQFQQGVTDSFVAEPRVQKSPQLTSHHFSKARINEYTAEPEDQQVARQQPHGTNKRLRHFKRVESGTRNVDPVSDDEDELSMNVFRPVTAPKMQVSSAKREQPVVRRTNRKSKGEKTMSGWPLIFARTHDFKFLRNVSREETNPYILLEYGDDPNTFCIVECDPTTSRKHIQARIIPKDVIKTYRDDTGKIRLEGPRRSNGNIAIFDLEFQKMADYRDFCDTHLLGISPLSNFKRLSTQMQTIFDKDLYFNDKVGSSALVKEPAINGDDQPATRKWMAKSHLSEQSLTSPRATRARPARSEQNSSAEVPVSTRSPLRPTRSTRASAPVHDLEPENDAEYKFSVEHGLGTPWLRPLTYGEGRRKAVVNFDDLPRLDNDEMLNDALIDFYMIYLFDKWKIPPKKIYFFNTYFYTRLTQNTGRASMNYDAVKRWTIKDDIFGYDYIVVPINEGTHWYLAIICNVGNIKRKPVGEDFGGSVVGSVPSSDAGIAEPGKTATSEAVADEQSAVKSQTPVLLEDNSTEHNENEANLFEEQSKIDLIDREAIATDGEQAEATRDSALTEAHDNENVQAGHPSIFDIETQDMEQQEPPMTVLSKLNASPARKKKLKRRSIAPKKDPDQPIIIILDSLGNPHSGAVRSLKDWLAAEGKARRGMEAVIKENGYYPKGDQIPTQSNFTDCGVYVLGYVDKFFENPDEFKRKLLTADMTADEDWPALRVKDMRNNLRDILYGLAEEQQLTEPIKKKAKKAITASTVATQSAVAPPTQTTLAANHSSDELPQKEAPSNMQAEGIQAAITEHTETSDTKNFLPPPRLLSPFKFVEVNQPAKETKSPDFVVKVSDSPPITVSPVKCPSVSPLKCTSGRNVHPEARIPVKVSSPQKGRSTNPNKRPKHQFDDSESIQAPTKRVNSAPLERSRTSPCAGASDRPIEIEDSQDRQSTIKSSPRKRLQLEGGDAIGHQLEAQLDAQDEDISRAQSHVTNNARDEAKIRANLFPPPKAQLSSRVPLPRLFAQIQDEPVADIMEIDSQGADPTDTSPDDVVRETPEPARRSPEWVY